MGQTKLKQTSSSNNNPLFDVNFYNNIKPFAHFEQFSDDTNYHQVPNSWYVFVADITNSTELIEKGRYKDVNIIGSACISVIKTEFGDGVPFSFGGDGATFLVPPHMSYNIQQSLLGVKALARENFGIDLRIGRVPVKTLSEMNQFVKVAKYNVHSKMFLAEFKGGGITLADQLVKSDKRFEVYGEGSLADLSGVYCRWEDIPNTNGQIITLMVKAETDAVYKEVWKQIEMVLGSNSVNLNPVKGDKLDHKRFWSIFFDEIRYQKIMSRKMVERVKSIWITFFLTHFKKELPKFFNDYKYSQSEHSDFRKFDDMLRTVLDCSKAQSDQIIKELSYLESKNLIKFGYHLSDNSLMTCVVGNFTEGNHVHFVDGDKGGYALAAKMIKSKK